MSFVTINIIKPSFNANTVATRVNKLLFAAFVRFCYFIVCHVSSTPDSSFHLIITHSWRIIPSPLSHILSGVEGVLSGPTADFIYAALWQRWRERKHAYTFPFYGLVCVPDILRCGSWGGPGFVEEQCSCCLEWEIQGHTHTKTQTPYATQDESE